MSSQDSAAYVSEWETELKTVARSVHPREFIERVNREVSRLEVDPERARCAPPHILIRSYEACCAYFQQHSFKALTESTYATIINHYHDFKDPYVFKVLKDLEGGADQFFHFMYRQQAAHQRVASRNDFVRGFRILRPFEKTEFASAFERCTKLSLRDWVACFSLVYMISSTGKRKIKLPIVDPLIIPGVTANAFEIFLDLCGTTTQNIQSEYLNAREKVPKHLWSQISPTLYSKPIIRAETALYVPFPGLLTDRLCQVVLDVLNQNNEQPALLSLSKSFEDYIEWSLQLVSPNGNITRPDREQVESRKRCDFAVQQNDAKVLIESKLASSEPNLVTAKAIDRNGTSTSIRTGFEQVVQTHHDNADARPGVGIVVTLGSTLNANTPSRREKLLHDLELPTSDSVQINDGKPPFAIDVDNFDLLILLAMTTGRTFKSLVDEWENGDYTVSGDLLFALRHLLPEDLPDEPWLKEFDAAVESLSTEVKE